MWETWNEPAMVKFAWGCGYCGCCLYPWKGMFTDVLSPSFDDSAFWVFLSFLNGLETLPGLPLRLPPQATSHSQARPVVTSANPHQFAYKQESNRHAGRLIHRVEHYEKQAGPLPRWSASLVLKGLLRQQKRDGFQIYNSQVLC